MTLIELEQKLIEVGRAMHERSLAWGTSGNVSARVDAATMLISASGAPLGAIKPGEFVSVRLQDGHWEGTRRPSKEVPMHLGIYQQQPQAQAVLHSSPFYTTLMACGGEPIPSDLYVETMYYLERIAWVDYAHPGSAELGESVKRAAAKAEIVMMRNHGVILFDSSFEEALLRLQVLEMACRMTVEAKAAGIALRRIPALSVHEFLHSGRYKARKPWPAAQTSDAANPLPS